MFGVCVEFFVHCFDGFLIDLFDVAFPAGVDDGDCVVLGIVEDCGLTVGMFDHEGDVFGLSYERVALRDEEGSCVIDKCDGICVDLLCHDDCFDVECFFNEIEVGLDVFRRILCVVSNVKGIKRRG